MSDVIATKKGFAPNGNYISIIYIFFKLNVVVERSRSNVGHGMT